MKLSRSLRLCVTLLGVCALILCMILVTFKEPNLSMKEKEILQRIHSLASLVTDSNRLYLEGRDDLESVFTQFSAITRKLLRQTLPNADKEQVRKLFSDIGLSPEGESLLLNYNWTDDLSLPSIRNYLPHVKMKPQALVPSFKLSKNRVQVPLVIGIPSVKRSRVSYLDITLRSIFNNMDAAEAADCLVILMIAELEDEAFVVDTTSSIRRNFKDQLASGLLEVIVPPREFYPNMSTVRQTLGDRIEQVQWRSKQNLDYAFLLMYAHKRSSEFYVQLEDDVVTTKHFVKIMKDAALEQSLTSVTGGGGDNWFVIDFCQLGFIGKMFHSASLPLLAQFFLAFYNDKPVDWLLEDILETKICRPGENHKNCKKAQESFWVRHKPSLFQHIGVHSSLKGKIQNLKDSQFNKAMLFVPHKNPPAVIKTNIKHYRQYSIVHAYRGENFYWGLVPEAEDFIEFILTPPVPLMGFRFVSGSHAHPSDKFFSSTSVDLLFDKNISEVDCKKWGFEVLADKYVKVSNFDENGVAERENLHPSLGDIRSVRLSVHATNSEYWVILSEIHLKVAVAS